MNKTGIYIISAVIFCALLLLMMGGDDRKKRRPDERVTLRRTDKIPYGTYVAYNQLSYLFPNASISADRSSPGFWDSLSVYDSNQALIILTRRFFPGESEMNKLVSFASKGNHVFISAREVSITVQQMMDLRASGSFAFLDIIDSLEVHLQQPPFKGRKEYSYPGKKYDAQLFRFDSTITRVLGLTTFGEPNLIQMKTGEGFIYLHLAPLSFSNYFLLHKKNMDYFNNTLSLIPSTVKRVVWDEYFLNKMPEASAQRRGRWLSVLMKQPPFKWGLLTALFAIIIYVLMEMRRKQRVIPVLKKPTNDSLDFVKTIGRLYYDKNDHLNLSRKMASYFLEHVRNRYKINTSRLDDNFTKLLHFKSGYPNNDVSDIVSFINFIENATSVNEKQLTVFYKQLENFYSKT